MIEWLVDFAVVVAVVLVVCNSAIGRGLWPSRYEQRRRARIAAIKRREGGTE